MTASGGETGVHSGQIGAALVLPARNIDDDAAVYQHGGVLGLRARRAGRRVHHRRTVTLEPKLLGVPPGRSQLFDELVSGNHALVRSMDGNGKLRVFPQKSLD